MSIREIVAANSVAPILRLLRNIDNFFVLPPCPRRRQREKRLRFQIKSALISNHDPFPYFQKLAQLLDQKNPKDSPRESVYSLKRLEINLEFPNKDIRKADPRRFAYKLRNLFGTGFKITLPNNYPILPSKQP